MFAEVNADKVVWARGEGGKWSIVSVDPSACVLPVNCYIAVNTDINAVNTGNYLRIIRAVIILA